MSQDILAPLLENTLKAGPHGDGRKTVGIIGTGNYAVALSKRLIMSGYDIVLGSRRPSLRQSKLALSSDCLCGMELTTISECLRRCQIVFIAIHMEDFKVTLQRHADQAKGKIVIDVSNRENRYAGHSNAELLATILPQAHVVKAFNSVSAFTMENVVTDVGTHRVFVASDYPAARATVSDLANSMGFRVVDLGGLKSARYMEDFVLKVFSHWKIPIFLTFAIFNLWSLYIVYIYFIEKTAYQWEQIFLKVLNKPLCMTAITVLALTYLPGHLAAIVQVYRGTKHRQFPKFLDTWLKSRKQLGLISLFLVTIHAIASALMLSPTYYRSWFHKATVTIPANTTLTSDLILPVTSTWMVWKGEAACLAGITAFVLMVVIGLTSIPSVGESLNWSEWKCIHSKLSYAVLVLSVGHVCIMGGPGWAKGGLEKTFRSITFLSVLLPMLVLVLKLVFICPPLSGYLRKIRRGWERKTARSPSLDNVENGVVSIEYESNRVKRVRLENTCGCEQGGEASGGACGVMKSANCECSSL